MVRRIIYKHSLPPLWRPGKLKGVALTTQLGAGEGTAEQLLTILMLKLLLTSRTTKGYAGHPSRDFDHQTVGIRLLGSRRGGWRIYSITEEDTVIRDKMYIWRILLSRRGGGGGCVQSGLAGAQRVLDDLADVIPVTNSSVMEPEPLRSRDF